MNELFVTVIIPTYNRAAQLSKALESVLQQTYSDLEIIVVNDGSTDDTREVVLNFATGDERVSLITQENGGAQKARNQGLLKAKGSWIIFLDSDNEYLPNTIEKLIGKVKENPNLDVVTCFSKVVDEDTNSIDSFRWKTEGNILQDILCEKTYVDYNSAIIRKTKLLEINGLDETFPSYQEWDTFIRLAEICEFGYIPELLLLYHKHTNNRISDNVENSQRGRYLILKKYKCRIKELCTITEYHSLLMTAYSETGRIVNIRKRIICKIKVLMLDYRFFVSRIFARKQLTII